VLENASPEKRPEQRASLPSERRKNQHGEIVCTFDRVIIWKRGFDPATIKFRDFSNLILLTRCDRDNDSYRRKSSKPRSAPSIPTTSVHGCDDVWLERER
jgi:hypothetical protein